MAANSQLPGHGHTVLIIAAHADDATLFCGGTLRLMADRGARIVMLRVTDDRYDSVGMSIAETIATNTAQMHRAARILGIDEIVELGWETDSSAMPAKSRCANGSSITYAASHRTR